MTTALNDPAGTADLVPPPQPTDHRGSAIPTFAMIAARFKELRKRRGLMITLIVVTIGIPVFFLVLRLLLHAFAPKTYGPAGGYEIYTAMVSGVLYIFGFIVAATLGASAGSGDLTEGMFRHQVVTGRSRLALYLARIPAGLAIIWSLVAIGFALVCMVCVLAAPTHFDFNDVSMPGGLNRAGLENWAAAHPDEVICNFAYRIGPASPLNSTVNAVPCGNGGPGGPGGIVAQPPGSLNLPAPSHAAIVSTARSIADMDYADYSHHFLTPPVSLMIKSGLWLELEALIGFTIGLGFGSLTGQRTVTVIVMIVLEVILTPIMSKAQLPHMINLQRAVVGVATAHLVPGGLPVFGGGGGGPGGGNGNPGLIAETTTVAVCVIVAWLVIWTALGAWRMSTRDA